MPILTIKNYSELLKQVRKFKFDSLLFEIYQNHDLFPTIPIIKNDRYHRYNDLIIYKHLSIYAITFTIFNRGLGLGCSYT